MEISGHAQPNSHPLAQAGYHLIDPATAHAAADATGTWWSETAAEYLAEHGDFLGATDFCWCPEGIRESATQLLGPLNSLYGKIVLEVGAGGAQCSRWLRHHGIDATASDVAPGMARGSAIIDQQTGIDVPFVTADARQLPFPDDSFDLAFTAHGAIPFVPDSDRIHAEVARVLHPGGLWVCAFSHPIRWAFPDDPGPEGLTACRSYFDRTPYCELDGDGRPLYAEFHRTIGDHIRELISAGFDLTDVIEPEWPATNPHTWGGWSPERGALLPGTMIMRARRRP